MTTRLCVSATLNARTKPGQKLLRELVAQAPKAARACYIGAAHEDDPDWARLTTDFFTKDLGIPCEAPRLSDPGLDVKKAKRAIQSADVLYLDGGTTLEVIRHAEERGLLDALRNTRKTASLIFGLSAGGCATAPFTVGWDEAEKPFVAPCLDLGLPHTVDVHDEPEWGEMVELLDHVIATRKDLEPVALVVPSGSCLFLADDGSLSSWGKAPCEKRTRSKGRWKIEPIPGA